MKILLIQHAKENIESYPIGLGYIAGVLLGEGHQVYFFDAAFESDSINSLLKVIQEFKPQALGFTLMTSQYSEFLILMRQIRARMTYKPTVVVGGAHASADSERVLRDGLANIVVRCEGEIVAQQLFYALERGDDFSQIKGIAYLDKNGNYVQAEDAEYIENLDALPKLPYNLLKIDRYLGRIHGLPVVNIQTSRGCPHKCVFCYRGPSGGRRVRFRSVHNVLQEISLLYKDYGFRAFNFCDDILTLKRDRILELCKMIIASNLKIFWTCETRVDCVDYELLSYMRRAGCVCIHFGVESESQEIIDKLQKKITKPQVKEAFANCQKLHIATLAFFMFGTPWDTDEGIRETIEFAKKLKSTITVFLCAMPYPGTQLRELFIESGMHVPEDYREYRQFIEGEYTSSTGKNKIKRDQSDVKNICINATKEIVKSQILDVPSYLRLVIEYINLYGLTNFIMRVIKRFYLMTGKS